MFRRIFIIVIGIILISMAKVGDCKVIVRSIPMKCEVSFSDEVINKDSEQIILEDIEPGTHTIVFKSGAEILKADVEVKFGDTLLINGNFKQMKVIFTPVVTMGKDGAPMVLIPAGEFQMGSDMGEDDELPIHTVYIDAFYMDVFEVTNAQYGKFMKETGYKAPRYWEDQSLNKPDQPVVGVVWDDAIAYCKWAGKRLPTEAEWEKAARGGLVGKSYPWGDESDIISMEESGGVTSAGTYPVGSIKPNNYGLYDMDGNAWEWCLDWYNEEYYAKSVKNNPKGPESGKNRVLRGGSWSAGVYYPLRVAYRYSLNPDQTSNLVGFRCIIPVQKQ